MPEETDFWRHVKEVATEAARDLLDRPTGITPGVHNGITFDRYGKALLAQTDPGGAMRLIGLLSGGSAVNVAQGGTARLPFTTSVYDSGTAVATGGSAAITAPMDGLYRADCGVFMDGTSGAYALNDFFDILLYGNASYLTTPAYENIDAGTYAPTIYLHGFRYIQLTAGESVYLVGENQSSVAGNASAPTGSADFFALTYIAAANAVPLVELLLGSTDGAGTDIDPSALISDPSSLTTLNVDHYEITIPTSGTYRFTYAGEVFDNAGGWESGDFYQKRIYVNGVDTALLAGFTVAAPTAPNTTLPLTGTVSLSLTAGDIIVPWWAWGNTGTPHHARGEDPTTPIGAFKMFAS